jgi:excisionase family DNA binding protein
MVNNKVNKRKNMENNKIKPKYITVAEMAKVLGVSRITVFNKIKKGQIPAEKIGRAFAIPYDYVEEFTQNFGTEKMTEAKKAYIEKAVGKIVKEYGETLKLLGKE